MFWILIGSVWKILNPGKAFPNWNVSSACKGQLFKGQNREQVNISQILTERENTESSACFPFTKTLPRSQEMSVLRNKPSHLYTSRVHWNHDLSSLSLSPSRCSLSGTQSWMDVVLTSWLLYQYRDDSLSTHQNFFHLLPMKAPFSFFLYSHPWQSACPSSLHDILRRLIIKNPVPSKITVFCLFKSTLREQILLPVKDINLFRNLSKSSKHSLEIYLEVIQFCNGRGSHTCSFKVHSDVQKQNSKL